MSCNSLDGSRGEQVNFQIRLVGGNNHGEGRVEIKINGIWGTICDDNWNLQNAQVVCRQLGFDKAMEALPNAQFGPGSDNMPILLDDVICYGNELSLSQCLFPPIGQHNCQHYEDVGVRCYCKFFFYLPEKQDYCIQQHNNSRTYASYSTVCTLVYIIVYILGCLL